MNPWLVTGVTVLAFILGAVPWGLVLSRMAGVDIRRQGSGNIGMANVWRCLGWKYALPTLLLDMAKVFAPTFALVAWQGVQAPAYLAAGAGILGHCYSPFLGFSGGKGVAATAGGLLALQPAFFLVLLCVYALCLFLTRVSSLSALCCLVTGGLLLVVKPFPAMVLAKELLVFFLLISLILIVRHTENIKRILTGRENKLF